MHVRELVRVLASVRISVCVCAACIHTYAWVRCVSVRVRVRSRVYGWFVHACVRPCPCSQLHSVQAVRYEGMHEQHSLGAAG